MRILHISDTRFVTIPCGQMLRVEWNNHDAGSGSLNISADGGRFYEMLSVYYGVGTATKEQREEEYQRFVAWLAGGADDSEFRFRKEPPVWVDTPARLAVDDRAHTTNGADTPYAAPPVVNPLATIRIAMPDCPCCKSNARVTRSPSESAWRGEYFCPCNEPGENPSGHFRIKVEEPLPIAAETSAGEVILGELPQDTFLT